MLRSEQLELPQVLSVALHHTDGKLILPFGNIFPVLNGKPNQYYDFALSLSIIVRNQSSLD